MPEEPSQPPEKNPQAVELGRKGGRKGGKARADKLSPEERQDSARLAAMARWSKQRAIPKTTHTGLLKIGGAEIACAVLDDERRVLSQRALYASLAVGTPGKKRRPGEEEDDYDLPAILSAKRLQPFINADLAATLKHPIAFETLLQQGGRVGLGYEASILPQICEVWLKARDAGVLHHTQIEIAERADLLMRGLAYVGVIALVDEATGFQYARALQALEKILEQFISKELLPWTKMFPDDFYINIWRLKHWQSNPVSGNKPGIIGHYTNDLVYERLAPGVLEELRRVTPRDEKGRFKHKLFQRLTEDVGHPRLREHLVKVIMLMNMSQDWEEFIMLVNRGLPRSGVTLPLPLTLKRPGHGEE